MAFKCLGCALREGSCGTAAGSWQAVCATCSTTPIHIPCDRVRLCPESLGKWSARRAPFMLWDTGAGAVVSARKFYLSPTPDGNVRPRPPLSNSGASTNSLPATSNRHL